MSQTYLQLINSVLRRMREAEVTTVSENELSALVGEFVNDAKREVEDAWNWGCLRTTIQISTIADTFEYVLTNAGIRSRILQVIHDTDDYDLRQAPSYQQMNRWLLTNNRQPGDPLWYDINGSMNGDHIMNLYPVPSATGDLINVNLVVPQEDFTLGTEILTVPTNPVVLRAHMWAIEERGDDGGSSLNVLQSKYDKSLGDAIAQDIARYPNEAIWVPE